MYMLTSTLGYTTVFLVASVDYMTAFCNPGCLGGAWCNLMRSFGPGMVGRKAVKLQTLDAHANGCSLYVHARVTIMCSLPSNSHYRG